MPNLVQFPLVISATSGTEVRMCSECEYGMHGATGIFCSVYREEIWDEAIAKECQDYEPLPWAGRKK